MDLRQPCYMLCFVSAVYSKISFEKIPVTLGNSIRKIWYSLHTMIFLFIFSLLQTMRLRNLTS